MTHPAKRDTTWIKNELRRPNFCTGLVRALPAHRTCLIGIPFWECAVAGSPALANKNENCSWGTGAPAHSFK